MFFRSAISKKAVTGRVILCVGFISLLNLTGCDIDWSEVIGDFVDADAVGTWSGSLTSDGVAQDYRFTVASDGSFVAGDGTVGTTSVSSLGQVVFQYYTSTGYLMKLKGNLNNEKTQITMTQIVWTGESSGSASFTGTLEKDEDDSNVYLLTDLVGTWSGTIVADGAAQNYQFTVDATGAFVAGDASATTGSVTITTSGVVTFVYTTGEGYTFRLSGSMNAAKTQLTMTTSTWSGPSSGSGTFAGILSKI